MQLNPDPPPLRYSVSRSGSVQIVSFEGEFVREAWAVSRLCRAELQSSGCSDFVFCLKRVTRFDDAGIQEFVTLQSAARSIPASLRVCGAPSAIRTQLEDAGALRPEELFADLHSAIRSIGTGPDPKA